MAKTNIYPPRTSEADATTRVEVGWHGVGTVQIATTRLTNPANLTAGEPAEPEWKSDTYVDLDRHGINQMIRALREARDRAYGRDE